jgi:hypothetical protein
MAEEEIFPEIFVTYYQSPGEKGQVRIRTKILLLSL